MRNKSLHSFERKSRQGGFGGRFAGYDRHPCFARQRRKYERVEGLNPSLKIILWLEGLSEHGCAVEKEATGVRLEE
jgi:hypothetical protein